MTTSIWATRVPSRSSIRRLHHDTGAPSSLTVPAGFAGGSGGQLAVGELGGLGHGEVGQLAQPHLQDGVPKPLEGDRQGVGVDGLLFRASQTHVDAALARPPGAHQPVGAGRYVAVDPVDATV